MDRSRFSWRDRRQERIHERLGRVSVGLAVLFRDACRLMAGITGLEAAPHFVAHACREVESGLRDVLRGVASLEKPRGSPDNHRIDIEAILDSLGIDPQHPIAAVWLALPNSESALHAMAHRRNLGVRTRLDEIERGWDEFQAILDLILDRLEATSMRAFEVIDALLADPSPASLARLETSMPQNQVTLGYFFDNAGADWLSILVDSAYLTPDEDPDMDGRLTPWAAGRWLPKVAASDPDAAVSILESIGSTVNPDAARAAMQSAAVLPPEKLAGMSELLAGWMQLDQFGDMRELGRAIAIRLTESGYIDAGLVVSRAVLGTA